MRVIKTGDITLPFPPKPIKQTVISKEDEAAITVNRGYTDLEEFIEEFGEVDEFHNINQAILAFLGEDQ